MTNHEAIKSFENQVNAQVKEICGKLMQMTKNYGYEKKMEAFELTKASVMKRVSELIHEHFKDQASADWVKFDMEISISNMFLNLKFQSTNEKIERDNSPCTISQLHLQAVEDAARFQQQVEQQNILLMFN